MILFDPMLAADMNASFITSCNTCFRGIMALIGRIVNSITTCHVRFLGRKDKEVHFSEVCRVMVKKFHSDPSNAEGAFRVSLARRDEKEMKRLFAAKDTQHALDKNFDKTLFSHFIKRQCGALFARKMTVDDAFTLKRLAYSPEEVLQFIASKINPHDASLKHPDDMLASAFSVFNAYRDLCRAKGDHDGPPAEYNIECLRRGGVAMQLFSVIADSPAEVAKQINLFADTLMIIMDAYQYHEEYLQ